MTDSKNPNRNDDLFKEGCGALYTNGIGHKECSCTLENAWVAACLNGQKRTDWKLTDRKILDRMR